MLRVGVLLCLVACVLAKTFHGDVVIRASFDPKQPKHVSLLHALHKNKEIDFWSDLGDMRLTPAIRDRVTNMLTAYNISYYTMIDNVQALIDQERTHTQFIRTGERLGANWQAGPSADFFDDYRDLDDINTFVKSLVDAYPSLLTLDNIGSSYENRTIYAVRLSGSSSFVSKPGVFFEGGIHAREWIAHATVLWCLYTMVTSYGTDDAMTALVNSVDFYVIPVVNVDGYAYTWATDGDRMWRKTRTPNAGSKCMGTDPNRNWNSHWCEVGASTDPCDDSYCGKAAFSEPCVKAAADYLQKQTNVKGYIDFHSYSESWMGPYGYTADLPKDIDGQTAVEKAAVAAIKKSSGLTYTSGPIYTTIYPASGSSADWAYDVCNVTYPYGVELRDKGRYGFVLPASNIVPSGKETLASIEAMANYILEH